MELLLKANEIVDLDKMPQNVSLQCQSGHLWVTCQGDGNDHVLKAGMEYSSTGRGKVVMMALSDVRVCVNEPVVAQQSFPARVLLQV